MISCSNPGAGQYIMVYFDPLHLLPFKRSNRMTFYQNAFFVGFHVKMNHSHIIYDYDCLFKSRDWSIYYGIIF